jgi:hypothetical protein
MKVENIKDKLEKQGFNVVLVKFRYWNNILAIENEDFTFFVANVTEKGGVRTEFKLQEVIDNYETAYCFHELLKEKKPYYMDFYSEIDMNTFSSESEARERYNRLLLEKIKK